MAVPIKCRLFMLKISKINLIEVQFIGGKIKRKIFIQEGRNKKSRPFLTGI